MQENENQNNQGDSENRYYSNLEPYQEEYTDNHEEAGQDTYSQTTSVQSTYNQDTYNQNPYGQNGYHPGNYGQKEPGEKDHGKGFAIAALVLGILSVLCFCGCINYVMAIAAIILAIIHLVRSDQGKGMAIAGIILSVISMILGGIFWIYMISYTNITDINSNDSFYVEEFQNGNDEYYHDYYDRHGNFHAYEHGNTF